MILSLALLLSGCTGAGAPAPEAPPPAPGPAGDPVAKHEWYVRHPTDLEAETVRLVLPMSMKDEIQTAGLMTGWRAEGDRLVNRGTGECTLRLRSLVVRAGELDVTLVPDGGEPEVVIQALGHASLAHSVRGVGSWYEDRSMIMIRNDRLRIAE